MTAKSRKTGFPDFVADIQSAEDVSRQFIDAPLAAAQQSALGSAAALATLLGMLPDAFAASQQRELNRILKSGNDNDPRVAALQASIEQAERLHTTARRGQARVQRALVALAAGGDVFHGFVSDSDLAPLEGLTVRLTETPAEGVKAFTATTEADGYFSIDLSPNTSTRRDAGAKASPINLSQRIAALFARGSDDRTTAPAGNPETSVGQVEILKYDRLLYRDPTLVALKEGRIYREYVIDGTRTVGRSKRAGCSVRPIERPAARDGTTTTRCKVRTTEEEETSATEVTASRMIEDGGDR